MGDAQVWDSRFSAEQYAYGREPNVFIKACAERYLKNGAMSIVELASGEGRNVAFLASQGHFVMAVDFSQHGLRKTAELAHSLGCADRVTTQHADILAWEPASAMDAAVMSYCHIASSAKPELFKKLATRILKPGGFLLLECFHPDQIAKGYRQKSGGPQDAGMMYTLDELRQLLGPYAGQELEAEQVEYELKEGAYHDGLGAVTRYVWQKAQSA